MKRLILALTLATAMFGCSVDSDTRQRNSTSRSDAAAPIGEVTVRDLHEEIQAERVALVWARGNGSSSGASVEGSLRNITRGDVHLNIHLSTPIYLSNSGAGQSMIAVQVLLQGGRYLSDGVRSFISLDPGAQVPVTFNAFCVDFDKENPSPVDQFTVASVPPILNQVMARIADYVVANPDRDITVAGQLAVWLAQGEAVESIRDRFDFTPADETLARTLIQ